MTKEQMKYKALFDSGLSVSEIAKKEGKSISTISRVLKRARNIRCPFGANCENCLLDDCAINEEYAHMVNVLDGGRNQHYKTKEG